MGFSNVAFLTSTLRYLEDNQKQFELANYRLSTGKRYSRLQDYGRLSNRLVDLRGAIEQIDSYKESIKQTKINIDAYSTSLQSLGEYASQISRWAKDVPTSSDNAIWKQSTKAFMKGVLLGITEDLNFEVGGRFIYGGSIVNKPPVFDLREVPLMGAGDSYTVDSFGAKKRSHTKVETGDDPKFIGRVPQYRYLSQDLTINHNVDDLHMEAGSIESYAIDTSAFTKGSGETLKYRVTLPGGAALPSWISYDDVSRKIQVSLPAGATATTAVQIQAENDEGDTITQTFNIIPTSAADLARLPSVKKAADAKTYVVGKAFTNEVLFDAGDIATRSGAAIAIAATTPAPVLTKNGLTVSLSATGQIVLNGTPPAGTTGDITFDIPLQEAGGGPIRNVKLTVLDSYALEHEYASYLTAWDGGPAQPGGYGVSPREPISIDKELWHRPTVSISRTVRVEFGMTAASPAFQKLVDAAIRLQSATQDGLDYDQRAGFIRAAKEIAEEARQAITALQSENNSNLGVFDARDKLHSVYKNLSQGELDDIVGISAQDATAELVNIQSMITNSYALIAKRQEMSLAKYL